MLADSNTSISLLIYGSKSPSLCDGRSGLQEINPSSKDIPRTLIKSLQNLATLSPNLFCSIFFPWLNHDL
jgi:hypothetical protein